MTFAGNNKSAKLILTLNGRFAPEREGDAYRFGVAGFAATVAKELARRKQLAGFLIYSRDESCGIRSSPLGPYSTSQASSCASIS
jgi:hypothetical protein